MQKKTAVIILIILISLFVADSLVLVYYYKNLSCNGSDMYDPELKLCWFSTAKMGTNIGLPVTASDCNAEAGESFFSGVCVYDQIGKFSPKTLQIVQYFWILFLVLLIIFLTWFIITYYFNQKKGKYINLRWFEDWSLWWATEYGMGIKNDIPTGKFIRTQERTDKRDGRDFKVVEVEIEGCKNPRGNGIFTWACCINNTTEEIMRAVRDGAFENASLHNFFFERLKYRMTSPESEKERLVDKILESSGNDTDKQAMLKEALEKKTPQSDQIVQQAVPQPAYRPRPQYRRRYNPMAYRRY